MVVNFNKLKLKNRKIVKNFNNYKFYTLVSKTFGVVTAKQLEAARRVIVKKTGKVVKLDIKINPKVALTAKPLESRMGKGKGKIKSYIHNIKPGQKVFEVKGIFSQAGLYRLLKSTAKKLPITLRV